MLQIRKFAQFTLLTTLMLAINVLCLAKCLHERHPAVHHTSHNTLPHSTQRGTSRHRVGAADKASAGDHVDAKIMPKAKSTVDLSANLALPSHMLELFAPHTVSAPLAEQPVLSLGSAARAPGAPRGPPTRS